MALHHPQVRAADYQEEVRAAEGVIPQVLQLARDAGVDLQQVGELVHQERKPLVLRQRRHLLPRLLPTGIAEVVRRRGLGNGEVVDRLGERAQLVAGRGGFGDPVQHTPGRPLLADFARAALAQPVREQPGLADPAPAVEDQERGLRPRPEAIQQLQLGLAAHERWFHLYHTLSL